MHMREWLLIALLVIAGALYYQVVFGAPIAFGDEGYYAVYARDIAQHASYPIYAPLQGTAIAHPRAVDYPFYFLLLSFGWLIGGEFGLKLLLPISALLAAGMLYVLLKEFKMRNAGLAAAFLLLMVPAFITYGVLAYVDITAALFVIAAACLFVRAEKHGSPAMVMAGVLAGLAMLTKITAVVLPLVFIAYFLLTRQKNWKQLVLFLAVTAAVVAPFVLHNLALFGNPCAYGINNPTKCGTVLDQEVPRLAGLESFYAGQNVPQSTGASIWQTGPLAFANFAFGWTIPVFFILGIIAAASRNRRLTLLLGLLLVFISIPVFMQASSGRIEDLSRYFIPAVPVLAAFGGVFAGEIYDFVRKRGRLLAIGITAAVLLLTVPYGWEKISTMPNVKQFAPSLFDACKWIDTNTPENAAFFTLYSEPTSYNCNRRAEPLPPGREEIFFTSNDTAYNMLKLHGIDYVVVDHFALSQQAYREGVWPVSFVQYMARDTTHYKDVYDNLGKYGNGGVSIWQVL